MERHQGTVFDIVKMITNIKTPAGNQMYKVFAKVVNSKDFRLPQRRERLYIVAIKLCGRPFDSVRLQWPKPLAPVGLSSIWDRDSVRLASYSRYPFPTTEVAQKNVKQMLHVIK
eukprot:4171540-Pyramimonas_sp.AAC.1